MIKRLLSILIFLFMLSPAWATDYYIDYDGGADTNNGTAEETPWKHFPTDPDATDTSDGHSLAAGNRYIFKRGVTYDTDAYLQVKDVTATSGNEIEIISLNTWGTGDHALFDGGDATFQCLWKVDNCDYIDLTALRVDNIKGYGFYIMGASTYVTIDECYSHTYKDEAANYHGFYFLDGNNITIEDSTAHQNSYGFIDQSGGANVVHTRCTSTDNGKDGFRTLSTAHAAVYQYCVAYDNDQDGWDLYGSKNKILRWCLAYDNDSAGYKLGGSKAETPSQADARGTVISYSFAWGNEAGFRWNSAEGITAYNCVAFDNDTGFNLYCIRDLGYTNTVKNCIGYNNNNWNLRLDTESSTSNVADYNIWYTHPPSANSVSWDEGSGVQTYNSTQQTTYRSDRGADEQNTLFDNPDFIDAGGLDFSIDPSSPAVDAGTIVAGYVFGVQAGSTWTANVTILDNNDYGSGGEIGGYVYDLTPTVTITATDPTASEEGQATGEFTATRTGSTSGNLVVNFTLGGTADEATDVDEDLSGGTLTILDGNATVAQTITPTDDSTVEGSETLTMTAAADSYDIGDPSQAEVTIEDNEAVEGEVGLVVFGVGGTGAMTRASGGTGLVAK